MKEYEVRSERATAKVPIKICLISLYSSSAVGLRYLASMLKQHGFDVSIVFFKDKDIAMDLMERPTDREYDLLIETLDGIHADLFGIGVRSPFLAIAEEITSRIQGRLSAPVLWGGTHPTVAPEESIRIADMLCVGEGEQAILDLAEAMSCGEKPRHISNLWFRQDGMINRNPIQPLWESLDSLPFPDYANRQKYFIQNNEVSVSDPGRESFNLDVLTSRGCPYHCSYCSNSILRDLYAGKGSVIRRRSVKNVLAEIKEQAQHMPALRRIDFIDEVFSWDKSWVEEFAEEYKRDIGLPFHCMQHPNTVNRTIMEILKNAGLERVEIGVQSGSERVRMDVFDRPVSDQKLIETSRIMSDLKIVPFYDIIVDNPFETPEDKINGLKLLQKIERPFHMHMFSLAYFPNTALTRRALDAKLIGPGQVEGRTTGCFDQFYVSLNHPRPSEDRFWLSLYSLTSKSFVPKGMIRMLSSLNTLKRHPAPLVAFANICNYLKLVTIAVKWLLEGKPALKSLKNRKKSAKQGSRIV